MSRQGPLVTLQMSCMGCVYEGYKRHWRRNDPGMDVYCSHPELKEDGLVGDTTWSTPSWCPLRVAALDAFLAEVKS